MYAIGSKRELSRDRADLETEFHLRSEDCMGYRQSKTDRAPCMRQLWAAGLRAENSPGYNREVHAEANREQTVITNS